MYVFRDVVLISFLTVLINCCVCFDCAATGAASASATDSGGGGEISMTHIKDALQRSHLAYDKGGDQHYDIISACTVACLCLFVIVLTDMPSCGFSC